MSSSGTPARRPDADLILGIGTSIGGENDLAALVGALHGAILDWALVVVRRGAFGMDVLRASLRRAASVPVVDVIDGLPCEPGRIHLAPSDAVARLTNGVFSTEPRMRSHQGRGPIDALLQSLAESRGPGAAGVLLSGTGTDGSLGLRAIRRAGGLALAQEPGSCRYDAMPRAAIAAGVVDAIVRPEDVPDKLAAWAARLREQRAGRGGAASARMLAAVERVTRVLREVTGHDLKHYQREPLGIRLERRMRLVGAGSVDDYVDRVRGDPGEAGALLRELLVSSPGFFRDARASAALAGDLLPRILHGHGSSDPVRIWVPGCGTGEEAYSLAMLVSEVLESMSAPPLVQVFATEADSHALQIARRGVYPATSPDDVTEARRERFFVVDNAVAEVRPEIRRLCLFSAHDVLRDPPLSRIDLISCRNVLGSLPLAAQKRMLVAFHSALRPGGCLFVGTGEAGDSLGELFEPLRGARLVWQRLGTSSVVCDGMPSPDRSDREDEQVAPAARRALLEEFAPAHVVVDARGQIVRLSRTAVRYTESGRSEGDLLESVREDLRAELQDALERSVQGSRREQRRALVRHAGGVQQVVLTVQPMAPDEGDAPGQMFLVVFHDVPVELAADLQTENEALARHLHGLESFINSSHVASLFLDEHGTLQRFTPAAEDVYNVIPSDIGRPLAELQHRALRMPPLPSPKELTDGAEPVEEDIRTDDGRWYLRRVHPYWSRDASEGGMVVTFHDVTELKQAELALREKSHELEEADRKKDEFLAILGHELRNPLAAIDAGLRVLDQGHRAEEDLLWTREMLREQTGHLTRIVDDLLDLTQISQGKIPLRKRRMNLIETATRAAEAARAVIEARQHELVTSADSSEIWMVGDPDRIEQVIVNLLTNAAKYTPKGGELVLAVRSRGAAAEIAVRDTGVGLAPENLQRIFEPFAQVRRGGVARGGLGIGLTLVRRVAELHGGRARAHSEGPGKGSAFVVTLPIEPAAGADRPRQTRSQDGSHRVPAGLRILVVDDNASAARGLGMLLEAAGGAVQIVESGQDALTAAREDDPQVVLLDIGLPDISGYEVAAQLRGDPRTKGIAIAAVSGFGTDEARARSKAVGFDRMFVKPVDFDALFAFLRGVAR